MNHKIVFPKYKQQLESKDLAMNEDQLAFYEQFEKVVYIGFGTEHLPTNETLSILLDFVKE